MDRTQMELHETKDIPWQQVEGYPEGVAEKILNMDPETGSHARLVKWLPGALTKETLSHDFYEEIYVIKGELIDVGQNLTVTEGFYGYRHPGMLHGPYSSPNGCFLFEIRTYP